MSKTDISDNKCGHYCSFCGMHLVECRWSHPGPGGVRICGECVAVCVELMAKGHGHWRTMIEVENAADPACEIVDQKLKEEQ